MNNNQKTILAIVAVLVVGFLLFNLSSKKPSLSPIDTLESDEFVVEDNDVVMILRKVQEITLDSSVFSNPVFNSLQDFSREIVEEPVGKPNPFEKSNSTQAGAEGLQAQIQAQ